MGSDIVLYIVVLIVGAVNLLMEVAAELKLRGTGR